jgi:hypothetical protein
MCSQHRDGATGYTAASRRMIVTDGKYVEVSVCDLFEDTIPGFTCGG